MSQHYRQVTAYCGSEGFSVSIERRSGETVIILKYDDDQEAPTIEVTPANGFHTFELPEPPK